MKSIPPPEQVAKVIADSLSPARGAERLRRRSGLSKRDFEDLRREFLDAGTQRVLEVMASNASRRGRSAERRAFGLVRRAIDSRVADLVKRPNVIGVAVGRKETGGQRFPVPCLTVYVTRKVAKKKIRRHHRIPSKVRISIGRGKHFWVPVDVVESGEFVRESTLPAATAVPAAEPTVAPGVSIGHDGYPDSNSGTFGCVVTDTRIGRVGTKSLLSCLHVLEPPGNDLQDFDVDSGSSATEVIVTPSHEDAGDDVSRLAVLVRGRADSFMDAAIAMLLQPSTVETRIGGVTPRGIRQLHDGDIDQTVVQMFARSGHRHGVVRQLDAAIPGVLDGLIMTDRMAEGGDSGGILLDMNWRVVGMLVGSTREHSCFIPFLTVAFGIGCKLVTEG